MIKTERIEFPGTHGDRIAARLELPAGVPRAYALFAHCFSCTKDYKAVVRISRRLAEGGLAVCRFDFTGLGESGGDFSQTNFSSNLGDLEAAAQFLRANYRAPQLLIGHSLGGAAMLAVAPRIPESRAVVTLAAPSDTEHLTDRLLRMAPELEEEGQARVTLGGTSFRVEEQLLEDLERHKMSDYLAALDRPLLILHSPADEILDIRHAERLFQEASHPKSFMAVDGADHLLASRPEDTRFVAAVIQEWFGRYLIEEGPDGEEAHRTEEREQVLVSSGPRGYATEIMAGRHNLRADEPRAVGGEDTGPNPYSYLLAALGACKAITLRMYADRKDWPLRGTRVQLAHHRIHASDCEDCETKDGWVDRIEVALGLEGELNEEQIRRLVEISKRCPVERTLKKEVSLRTTTV